MRHTDQKESKKRIKRKKKERKKKEITITKNLIQGDSNPETRIS